MVRLRVVEPDGRSPTQRAQDLHRARDLPQARERLAAVLEPLRELAATLETSIAAGEPPSEGTWARLDAAYVAAQADA